jgi:peroxiredoxin (alkyl hydroperoxide reductase subunit C)
MLEALQHVENCGEVCPADWNTGKSAISPTLESVSQYLGAK